MQPITFGVNFIVRNERVDNHGLIPLYCKITINGQVLKISINQNILAIDWNDELQLPKKSCKNFKTIQKIIESFKSRVYQVYSNLLSSNTELTASNFKTSFIGKKTILKTHTLIETATEHNINFEKMIGIKYSYGSYKNYKTTLKYLIEFIPIFYKKKDIPLTEVDYKFCDAFFSFLTTTKACKNNGANKQIQRVKKIINYAIRLGYIVSSNMGTYTLSFKPAKRSALTLIELGKLESLSLERKDLERVRDIFIFQCYTGLSYIDIKRLEHKHIYVDDKEELWIKMERQKTGGSFSIPLLKPALRLLQAYKILYPDEDMVFPVLSNQKMNNHLKILQELDSISKNLSTHIARHTFATTITLSNNVPIETVSRMLGHTTIRTTQIYAKVLDTKIETDMANLKNQIK